MKSVFADTFHFLVLLRADDPKHSSALKFHRIKWRRIVTTDCVLLEVGDACSHPRHHGDFLALYEVLARDERVEIVRLTPELLDRGVALFRSRADKEWPLTDCISFVVMQDHELAEALTADHHFVQAGFKALLA